MCGVICGVITTVVAAILVVATSVGSFVFLPGLIENIIVNEVVLKNDTIQMERFQEIPFPLNFTVRLFNLTNAQDVVTGAVPVVNEVGPYVYRLFQSREIISMDEDVIRYRRRERFEFDPVASYPNTENDMVTIINVPYHAIIQVAERFYPALASVLNLAMGGIFGQYNSPVADFRIRDLLFDGLAICVNPGLVASVACSIIRTIGATAQNLVEQDDGSVIFSVLAYKENPSEVYEVRRGLEDPAELGLILKYNNETSFPFWVNDLDEDGNETVSVCNMINGTDSGIFAPFVNQDKHMYAINTDICRSVELRYQFDTVYEGIPAVRYSANEWFMDNDDGCFCLNVTGGVNREDGCLLRGAMELYSCVGAFLVLSYPHFLYADMKYRNGVLGMTPNEEDHRIYMDIEPNTGTPVRGAKRAQFNIFIRPVSGISSTQNLRNALVPFLWVEEGISLPQEYVDELTNRLLFGLRMVDILVPVLIASCAAVMVIGVIFTMRGRRSNRNRTPQALDNEVFETAEPKVVN